MTVSVSQKVATEITTFFLVTQVVFWIYLAKSVVIGVPANTMGCTPATDAVGSSSAASGGTGPMFVRIEMAGPAPSTKHIVTSAEHVGLRNAFKQI